MPEQSGASRHSFRSTDAAVTEPPSPRRIGAAALLCWTGSLIAAFGWGNHWNAYTNLSLTLGDLVLWATFFTALHASRTPEAVTSEAMPTTERAERSDA